MNFLLLHQDSNLERQNQNLLCYRYTMQQFHLISDLIEYIRSIKDTSIVIKLHNQNRYINNIEMFLKISKQN